MTILALMVSMTRYSQLRKKVHFFCLNGHGPEAWCYNAPYASMNKISFIKASLAGKVCY